MGNNARYWCILIGLLVTGARVIDVRAQEACPREGSSAVEELGSQPSLASTLDPRFACGRQANTVSSCKTPFCAYDCRSEGAFFNLEGLWIGMHERGSDMAERLVAITSGTTPGFTELSPSPTLSPRISAGWQTCDGFGFRVRYWNYNNTASVLQTSTGPAVPNQAVHSWATNVLDVEGVMNHWGERLWDSTVSAGYRFVDYREGAATFLNGTQLARVNSGFLGNGITGAGELRYSLSRNFGLVANARGSLLLGNERFTPTNVTIPTIPSALPFDAKFILESQLAGEFRYPICGGGYWFGRLGYEVQYWNDFVLQLQQRDSASVIFSGFFASVGLQR